MKRILAIFAVVMCLAGCMIPMAFADEIVSASSNVRIAGFGYGLRTLNPSATPTHNAFGGVFVHGDITVKSVSVSDVQWRADNSAQGGYFFLWYTIDVEPINQADVAGDVVASIPIEWTDGMKVEYTVSTLSDYFTTSAITVNSSTSTHLGLGFSDVQMYSIGDGSPYMCDLSGKRLLKAYWMPTTADAELTRINIMVKIWDPNCTTVTTTTPKDFVGWITYPFDILLDNLVVLQTVNVFATAPVMSEYLMMGASFLVICIIISGL